MDLDPDPQLFAGSETGSGSVIINFGSGSYELQFLVTKMQSWALALFFQVRPPLSIAHFADFQVRSWLNCSQKDQWFALGKLR